jgi:hypothetical protein
LVADPVGSLFFFHLFLLVEHISEKPDPKPSDQKKIYMCVIAVLASALPPTPVEKAKSSGEFSCHMLQKAPHP